MAILVILAVIVSSCAKGDAGPQGPAGPAGDTVFLLKFQSGVYPDSYYNSVIDTNLNNLSGANYGVCESNWIGSGTGGNIRRAIIRFGALKAYLPSDAVIVKAYVTVRLESFNGSGNTLAAHSMTTSFTSQGTSCGSLATDGPRLDHC